MKARSPASSAAPSTTGTSAADRAAGARRETGLHLPARPARPRAPLYGHREGSAGAPGEVPRRTRPTAARRAASRSSRSGLARKAAASRPTCRGEPRRRPPYPARPPPHRIDPRPSKSKRFQRCVGRRRACWRRRFGDDEMAGAAPRVGQSPPRRPPEPVSATSHQNRRTQEPIEAARLEQRPLIGRSATEQR